MKEFLILIRENKAVAAVEFAIILPIIVLLIIGGLETGMYFLQSQVVQRSVTITTNSLQINQGDASYTDATQAGLSFVNLQEAPNYVCAKAYQTQAQAVADKCLPGEWETMASDAGVNPGEQYYVSVVAHAEKRTEILISDYLPAIVAESVVPVNQGSSLIPEGAVVAFNKRNCPTGWRNITSTVAGRVIIGRGSYSERSPGSNPSNWNTSYSLGATGGSARYSMRTSEMPKHNHDVRFSSNPDNGNPNGGKIEYDWASYSIRGNNGEFLVANGDGVGPFAVTKFKGGDSTDSEGEAAPFDKRMPYYALTYCEKE